MNKLRSSLFFAIALLYFAIPVAAKKTHPLTYLDRGACPFECCTYQRWTVAKDTVAYAEPNKGSKRMGLFKKGSRVRGLTGEVRTIQPGKLAVTKPHEKYKPATFYGFIHRRVKAFTRSGLRAACLKKICTRWAGLFRTRVPHAPKHPIAGATLKQNSKTTGGSRSALRLDGSAGRTKPKISTAWISAAGDDSNSRDESH